MSDPIHALTDSTRTSVTKRVVVVADNSLIVEAVRLGLRRSGASLEVLGHVVGRDASASTVIESAPMLVLLDDMDQAEHAIALVQDIRRADGELVIMILTARLDGAWLERAFAAGATGAFSKSIQPGALATLIRAALKGQIVHAPFTSFEPERDESAFVEPTSLTQRELEILGMVASGGSNAEIARMLWVTQPTVKFHLRNIYRKLGVGNRTEACHYAHLNGMLGESAALRAVSVS